MVEIFSSFLVYKTWAVEHKKKKYLLKSTSSNAGNLHIIIITVSYYFILNILCWSKSQQRFPNTLLKSCSLNVLN